MHTIVVTSHRGNEAAVDSFLASITTAPDVIVVVGDTAASEYQVTGPHHGVTRVVAPHNSIDYTGLIALLEVPSLQRPSYFYTHDTCKAGPRFLELLAAHSVPYDTASFKFHSMNIGVYSRAALERFRDEILAMKNRDPARVQESKKACVANEDLVFRLNGSRHVVLGREHPTYEPVLDVYGNGVMRRATYYPCLDFYKYAANWYTKDAYELRL